MYSFYPDVAFVRLSRKILQFHNCGVGIPPNNIICVQFPTRCCFQGKYFKSYSHQCHSYRRDIVSMTWLPQFWSGVSPRQHTHVCVHCTVSIQMLISISTIKENIQLTKIRLSQSLERDIFLHFYIIFENSEIVTTEQNLILNSAIYTASIQRSFGIQIAKENTTVASNDRGVDQFLEFGCLLALYISWEFPLK